MDRQQGSAVEGEAEWLMADIHLLGIPIEQVGEGGNG